MTEAELLALCRRHGIEPDEGREVLKEVENLTAARPSGIGLPPDAVGSLLEITAHMNDVLWETRPFNGGEFFSTAQRVVAFFREMAGPKL
jgi:hypothetical protein